MKIIYFGTFLDILINILKNTMVFDNTKIKNIELNDNISGNENYYDLRVVISEDDNDINIKFTLYKTKNTYIIRSTFVTFYSRSDLNCITPYYYEGLTKLRICVRNALEGLSLTEGDLKEYDL